MLSELLTGSQVQTIQHKSIFCCRCWQRLWGGLNQCSWPMQSLGDICVVYSACRLWFTSRVCLLKAVHLFCPVGIPVTYDNSFYFWFIIAANLNWLVVVRTMVPLYGRILLKINYSRVITRLCSHACRPAEFLNYTVYTDRIASHAQLYFGLAQNVTQTQKYSYFMAS